jgi:hypothetical protein
MSKRYVVLLCAAALSIGVAVPAIGASQTGSTSSAQSTAKKALKLAKAADKRSKLALKNAVAGPAGGQGSSGTAGKNGADGVNGADGAGRAWAHIAANGAVSQAKNVTAVRDGAGSGTYCLKVDGFVPQNVVASISWSGSGLSPVIPKVGTGLVGGCNSALPGSNAYVITHSSDVALGVVGDTEFYVLIN